MLSAHRTRPGLSRPGSSTLSAVASARPISRPACCRRPLQPVAQSVCSSSGSQSSSADTSSAHAAAQGHRVTVATILGTTLGSWAIALPGLGGGASGPPFGNGGGGSWGAGGGCGGDGAAGGSSGPLYDLAADNDGDGTKQARNQKQQQAEPQEEDVDDFGSVGEDEVEQPAAGSQRNEADVLITSETEHEENLKEAGLEGDDKRHGTKRCVEVVIEGWPQVGALPKQVSSASMLMLHAVCPCRTHTVLLACQHSKQCCGSC